MGNAYTFVMNIHSHNIYSCESRFGKLYCVEGSKWASLDLDEVIEQAEILEYLNGR
jgi:hypothetical protein